MVCSASSLGLAKLGFEYVISTATIQSTKALEPLIEKNADPRLYTISHLLSCQERVMFAPHANLSEEVNSNIIQSEVLGGVSLQDLQPATVLLIQTCNHCYTVVLLNENSVLISGHPTYCPEPLLVVITGSTWGGSMLKRRYIGRGMHLEFCHPEYHTPIVTSPIQEIRECPQFEDSIIASVGTAQRNHSREQRLPYSPE